MLVELLQWTVPGITVDVPGTVLVLDLLWIFGSTFRLLDHNFYGMNHNLN